MTAQELAFELSASGEQVVRTYECTKLRRWLQPETIGFLTVTNKRIVFHSKGKSITGSSLLMSEMPIDDVAGVSAYEGLSINWVVFLALAVLAFIATQVIGRVLPSFLTSFPVAILLMLPFAALWLLTSDILSTTVKEQVVATVRTAIPNRADINSDLRNYREYARVPLYIGLIMLIWRLSAEGLLGFAGSLAGSLFLMITYGLVFFLLFGREHTFSLAIGSKTKKDSGIYIPGDGFQLFSRADMVAMEMLSARPAADASRVTRELGAMLMDIQQLGDFGIAKWQK